MKYNFSSFPEVLTPLLGTIHTCRYLDGTYCEPDPEDPKKCGNALCKRRTAEYERLKASGYFKTSPLPWWRRVFGKQITLLSRARAAFREAKRAWEDW